MKTLFKSIIALAIVATAFTSCVKEENAPVVNNSETKTVQFFANPIETKTAFGTPNGTKYPTLWTEGDKVKILVNLDQIKDTEKSVAVTCSQDYTSASFQAELAQPEAETYTFYSISPSDACIGKSSTKRYLYIQIPVDQKPLTTSVDKAAQVLYATSATTETMPTSADLTYSHLTAYGKFSLKNLSAESISSIMIESPEDVYIAGKWDYFVDDETLVVRNGNGSNHITLTTTNVNDIWFACAPVDVSGKTLTFTVTTDKGDLVKEINFPKGCEFKSGKIASFSIDMDGIEVEEEEETSEAWTLVTKASDLAVGDKVIIAAKDYNYAISTTQDSNNRGQAPITKNGNILATPGSDVQMLTLTAGTTTGTFGFYTGTDYLYAASSSKNYLKSQTKIDENASWTVTIAADGTASIVANGNYTRNVMQYNQSSSLFACYSSASQKALVIYKYSPVSGGEDDTTDPTPDPNPDQPEDDDTATILFETFDDSSTSDSSNAIDGSTFANFTGATDKAYKSQYGGIKLGSSKAAGYITSKSLNLSSSFTVTIDACKYGSDTGNIIVTVGSTTTKTISNSELGPAGTFKTFTLSFDATTETTVKIATSAKRAYIDNVKIIKN